MDGKQILLYFGSFNPVHIGHLLIAQEALIRTAADELWFVVSPQNPLKKSNELISEKHRKKMLEIAIKNYNLHQMMASDIEFELPRPSYTANTLRVLTKTYPSNRFGMLIGGDNLQTFHRWKEYEYILEHIPIFVYARTSPSQEKISEAVLKHPHLHFWENIPLLDISSSQIRQNIHRGQPYDLFLPYGVATYIRDYGLYRDITENRRTQ